MIGIIQRIISDNNNIKIYNDNNITIMKMKIMIILIDNSSDDTKNNDNCNDDNHHHNYQGPWKFHAK